MDLEHKAIERIKTASEMSLQHYGKPLVCTYSGGKDSDVMLELFKRAGIPFEAHHNHTTVDAPPTVYHIRKRFRKLELEGINTKIEMPTYQGQRTSMWKLIPLKKMPPSRMMRYCCSILKETGCTNRFIATGVRWDESNARTGRESFEGIGSSKAEAIRVSDEVMLLSDNTEKRKLIEHCQMKSKSAVNPIIDWCHKDIWDYIRSEKIEYNPLYEEGYPRVGCVGCPMAGKRRWKQFADFPTYQRAYIKAFDMMLEVLKNSKEGKKPKWKSGEEVFLWWMEDKNVEGQISFTDIPGVMP